MAASKHHQRTSVFSGLCFYRRFISNFSQVCAPLTTLLRNKPKSLSWMPTTTDAFHHLKEDICSALTLAHSDPQLPFIMEVNASIVGVGAVLSQCHREPPFLHPCTFYSKKLSPAEQNYNIGNRTSSHQARAGDTGWREPITPLKGSWTTATWNISAMPNNLIPYKPVGLFSSRGSTLQSITVLAPRTRKQTHSPESIPLMTKFLSSRTPSPSSLEYVLQGL